MTKITAETILKREANTPWKEIEKEGMVLNLKNGDYFAMNGVGLFIWKSLSGAKTLGDIAKRISSHYKVSRNKALSDLLKFIKALFKKGLITICGD
jgi:hypothetical protein